MNIVEEYLDWLKQIVGDGGKIYDISGMDIAPQIFVVIFDQVPEVGHKTAYSFGLSSVAHPEWRFSRPELVISVKSDDNSWGLAMGEIIRQKRGSDLFEYGSVFQFGERISDESEMSAFLVFANSLYDPGQETATFCDRSIGLSQLYPIYADESETIKRIGVEAFFFRCGIDFYDVRRKKVV
jgi:hypothetical protein